MTEYENKYPEGVYMPRDNRIFQDLTAHQLCIWLALLDKKDAETGLRISFRDLSCLSHIALRTTVRSVDELERKGYLEIIRGGGRGNPNSYRVLYPYGKVYPTEKERMDCQGR